MDEMKYYLAGPMTGLPRFNYPAFDHAASVIRGWGFDLVSAHEIDFGETEETRGKTKPYLTYLKTSLQYMLACDAVIFLPNWASSKGCRTENSVAIAVSMERWRYEPARDGVRAFIRQLR